MAEANTTFIARSVRLRKEAALECERFVRVQAQAEATLRYLRLSQERREWRRACYFGKNSALAFQARLAIAARLARGELRAVVARVREALGVRLGV